MLRSHTRWFVPIALALVSFESANTPASAQTTYPFSTKYDILTSIRGTAAPDVLELLIEGESTDALYGLTSVNSLTYAQINFATSEVRLGSDSNAFGVQGLPLGLDVLFGSGSDKLFGTNSSIGSIDFETFTQTLSGTFTITGGEGRFSGATGALAISGTNNFSPDLTSAKGQLSISGSFKVVPEPSASPMLVGMGMLGAGFLLRKRGRRSL